MKLPDFSSDVLLNELRDKIGADYVEWDGSASWNAFDPFGFRQALRDKGEVDIPFSEIEINSDKTLELFGRKILVYIRDQRYAYDSQYRFHISNCRTLIDAQTHRRYDKYVASINSHGKFMVNIIHGSNWVKKDQEIELKVCKNCLSTLNYHDYLSQDAPAREKIHKDFSIASYFEEYKTQNIRKPNHTNVTAPLNNYTSDFSSIADRLKKDRNYRCEKCGINLQNDTRYLHVHHVNGIKSNNKIENLKVLCIGCHAKEPGHSHMNNLPDLKTYKRKYGWTLF
jgi:hypothetical protein